MRWSRPVETLLDQLLISVRLDWGRSYCEPYPKFQLRKQEGGPSQNASMIYVDLSTGDGFGWGICGDNLATALAALTRIERIDRHVGGPRRLPGPLLQKISTASLRPRHPGLTGAPHVGYAFFEDDLVAQRGADEARRIYDVIVTGSRWCEDVLRRTGLTNLATILQGVDHARFYPSSVGEVRRDGRFIIFSGGKFELRKGQDLVALAFKAFAARHPDAFLVAAWHNQWPEFVATMAGSRCLPFQPASTGTLEDQIRKWLRNARVNLQLVKLIPALPNASMAAIYRHSDVGLFPSRCEGGTNLVMMEYMACGRAPIATAFSGHLDVLTDENSYQLRHWTPLPIRRNGTWAACWCEPTVDELVARLENAYENRERLAARGQQVAIDMQQWTWDRAAREFLRFLN